MIIGAGCQCGKNIIPYRKQCPACGKAMEEVSFGNSGWVLTHTTLYAAPEGFQGPIRLAMVELEGGANLLCTVKGESEIHIGDEVRVEMEGEHYSCEPL